MKTLGISFFYYYFWMREKRENFLSRSRKTSAFLSQLLDDFKSFSTTSFVTTTSERVFLFLSLSLSLHFSLMKIFFESFPTVNTIKIEIVQKGFYLCFCCFSCNKKRLWYIFCLISRSSLSHFCAVLMEMTRKLVYWNTIIYLEGKFWFDGRFWDCDRDLLLKFQL